jgi:predicted metal-dependent hydrolase
VTDFEGYQITCAKDVPLDWTCGPLAEGLSCYEKSEFFLAHEAWESVWLTLEEPEKSFLQALIQVAAAFHHLQGGKPAGAISLLRRALRRLELYPASFGGIAVTQLCAEVCEWLRVLESGLPFIAPNPPRIVPIDLPSEQVSGS